MKGKSLIGLKLTFLVWCASDIVDLTSVRLHLNAPDYTGNKKLIYNNKKKKQQQLIIPFSSQCNMKLSKSSSAVTSPNTGALHLISGKNSLSQWIIKKRKSLTVCGSANHFYRLTLAASPQVNLLPLKSSTAARKLSSDEL